MAAPELGRLVDHEGVWCEILATPAPGTPPRPALFLDRDGVVVEETGYLARVEDVALIPGAASVIASANARRVPVVIVTNQAGIGRGYFGWDAFAAVQARILAELASLGAKVDAVYATPHHPSGQGAFAHPDHPARKPNPGMLARAARDLGLDLGRSWLVGDNVSDIEAAKRAGLAGALQVLTGHGETHRATSAAHGAPGFEVVLGKSIADALPLIARLAAARGV